MYVGVVFQNMCRWNHIFVELPKIPTVIDVLTELTKPSVLHSQKEKLERKLKENNVVDTQKVDNKEGIVEPELIKLKSPDRVYKLELTENDKLLLKKLDMEHRAKLIKEQNREENKDLRTSGVLNEKEETKLKEKEASGNITAVPNPKSKQKVK